MNALRCLMILTLLTTAAALEVSAEMGKHVLKVTEPIVEAEDGLLLGNGDLSVSVYQSKDRILWRFGKGDVWDRRVDRSDDPRPPTIKEIAHGIAVERWKCSPYGDGQPVALNGTDNPQRMKELCTGTPASYRARPYPCPKPVGELALQLPPDLPDLQVRQELSLEEGILRIFCSSRPDSRYPAVELRITCFVPPAPNVLVVKWELTGWDKQAELGHDLPPVWLWLYRWADPTIREFGQRFAGEYLHDAFSAYPDAAKCTPLPKPTVLNLHGRPVIEQTFQPEPTFLQGFRYLMAPYVAAGDISPQDLSAAGEARLRLWPPREARSGWVVVGVPSESDPGGSEAELGRLNGMLAERPAERLAAWEQATRDSAAAFWARSAVHISDPLLENLWYETYHARRCTTRAGKTPPGLFLPSTVRDYSHWHGDYHTNYNYQQPYYGDYTANQLDLGDAYFTGMEYLLQMGRLIAEKYYGARGAFIQLSGYPIKATDDVLGCVPMGRMAYMTGWCANQYWWRYLYTRDDKWLREVGYPAMRDCALFYLDFMEKRADGLYHVFPSNQGEDGFTGNAQDYTDRWQVMRHVRNCLRCAIQASEVLGADADLRQQWQERLDHCAGDDGRPPVKLQGPAKRFQEACPPEFGDGAVPAPPLASADEAPFPDLTDGFYSWYAGQYPICMVATVRGGGIPPARVYAGLRRLVERWRHPNGLIWAMSVANYGHCGAWTETLGICAPLQEMMLQSYGGVVRIFPQWPAKVPASFENLRAEGAFLVSARWAEGAVAEASLRSEKGGPCEVFSPWREGLTAVTTDGKPVPVEKLEGGVFRFQTEAGGTYKLRRAGG